jgi:hypothetical protein
MKRIGTILALVLAMCLLQTQEVASTSGSNCSSECERKYQSCLAGCDKDWRLTSAERELRICKDECGQYLTSCQIQCKEKTKSR